jgi:prevent-host-death family protein
MYIRGTMLQRASMYTSGMTDAPALEPNIPVHKARDVLGKVIEKSRYFGGITYLTNRGTRVAAVVPVDLAEWFEANAAAVLEQIRLHQGDG